MIFDDLLWARQKGMLTPLSKEEGALVVVDPKAMALILGWPHRSSEMRVLASTAYPDRVVWMQYWTEIAVLGKKVPRATFWREMLKI
jgi:predicted NUDIX family NTP pyrophosphohydrolase